MKNNFTFYFSKQALKQNLKIKVLIKSISRGGGEVRPSAQVAPMIKNISAMSINIIKLNNTKIIGSYKRIRGDLDFGLEKMKFVLKNVKALKLETVRLDCSIHMSKTREKVTYVIKCGLTRIHSKIEFLSNNVGYLGLNRYSRKPIKIRGFPGYVDVGSWI